MDSDEKGFLPIGGLSAQTVAIIAIVVGFVAAWQLGYIDFGPRKETPPENSSYIELRLIDPDGNTLEVINSGEEKTYDMQTFGIAKTDSGKVIDTVDAYVHVTPNGTGGVSDPVSFNASANYKILDSNKNAVRDQTWSTSVSDANFGQTVTKKYWESNFDGLLNAIGYSDGSGYFVTQVDITGTAASGETAQALPKSSFSFSWTADSLTISADIDVDIMQVVE